MGCQCSVFRSHAQRPFGAVRGRRPQRPCPAHIWARQQREGRSFFSRSVSSRSAAPHALASPRRLASWSRHREPVARECPTICSFPTTLSSPLSLSLSAACGEACGTVSSTIRCGQAYPNFTCHCWTRGDGSLVRGHACRARARRKRIWSGTEASARQFGSSTCGACSVRPSEHCALHASSRRPPRHHHADVCHWHRCFR